MIEPVLPRSSSQVCLDIGSIRLRLRFNFNFGAPHEVRRRLRGCSAHDMEWVDGHSNSEISLCQGCHHA
jgi:hypothetical protein